MWVFSQNSQSRFIRREGGIKVKLIRSNTVKGKQDDTFSYLGSEIVFTGKIKSKGTVSIEGHVKGDVSSIENLVVCKDAVVESNLDVSSAILYGEVRGNINACDIIKILSTGRVYGDIISPNVIMEPGAIIDGRCTVRSKPALKMVQFQAG